MERTLKAVHGSLNVTVPKNLADALGWRKGDRVRFERREQGAYLEAATKTEKPVLVTIGYAGHSPESFLRALRTHNVQTLVDIRDLPLSRRRGFSKSSLASALAGGGIEYRHMRPLGAPKAIRDPYKRGGPAETFRGAYRAHLARQNVALEALQWVASHRRVAIMCVEQDHRQCHRGLLAGELEKTGFAIVNA